MFRRVYVIQCKSTGEFLSSNLFYVKRLGGAGRLYDPQEARDTAELNLGDDFEISSFWEGEPD